MKCPKCGSEMKEKKVRREIYTYICPKCHYHGGAINQGDKSDASMLDRVGSK